MERALKAMDVKTRKCLTIFDVFQRKSSVDQVYMYNSRGLISVTNCVYTE